MSEMGHKPRRRSEPGIGLCPQYLPSRRNLVHRSERRQVPITTFRFAGTKVILLDHLVGKREQLVWNFETQRLGGLDVYHEIEPCGLLDGDFAWFHPAQNLID
jgi:hypothetical protein